MRFLIDAGMPRATASLIQSLGHDAVDVRDLGWGAKPDSFLAEVCRVEKRCLITRDFDFADIRMYPPVQYHGLMVLKLPEKATRAFILALVSEVMAASEMLERLDGRLAIVEVDRVRLRPSV